MQITPQIYAIRTPQGPAKDRFVYVYLVFGERILVVDTGFASATDLILGEIRSAGRDPAEIDCIVLTHGHPDHAGSARAIRDLTGCTVAAHPMDRAAIEQPDPALLAPPAPGIPPLVSGPVPVGRLLGEGDTVSAGRGLDLTVLSVPGHTPGSIALHLKDHGILLAGDAVQPPGRMPIFTDPVSLVRSIRRLETVPGLRHLLQGHDDPATGPALYRKFGDSVAHLRQFHDAVAQAAAGAGGDADPQELADRVLAIMGLPAAPSPQLAAMLPQIIRADLGADGYDRLLGE